jgi:hypothetical protein
MTVTVPIIVVHHFILYQLTESESIIISMWGPHFLNLRRGPYTRKGWERLL